MQAVTKRSRETISPSRIFHANPSLYLITKETNGDESVAGKCPGRCFLNFQHANANANTDAIANPNVNTNANANANVNANANANVNANVNADVNVNANVKGTVSRYCACTKL